MSGKIRTVIVDDSAIARGIFEKALKGDGDFSIVSSLSNGRKAVDFCRENSVDLVVSDCDMPEMTGADATRIISGEFGIPVIQQIKDSLKTRPHGGRIPDLPHFHGIPFQQTGSAGLHGRSQPEHCPG